QAGVGAVGETEVEVCRVGTGTGANGLCTTTGSARYGAVYVSDAAHVHDNECGGAEFWSGGNARTIPVPGADGKMSAAKLAGMVDEALARPADVPPRAGSITPRTEASTLYTLSEVRALAQGARARRPWGHIGGAP